MSTRRTAARVLAASAAAATVTLIAAAPAFAHVSMSVSDPTAGAFTVATVSVPHGCDGSPTTKIEIQIPEQVLSVTPTRNPFWDVETTIETLDEPVTDAHGNEITERIGTVVYTAETPLPDGQRDTFELSFQVPDAAGEVLVFPTVQTCEEGETGWVEVPADGQDGEDLEHPAPAFEVVPAADGAEAGHGDGSTAEPEADDESTAESDSDALGWVALVAGVLGLVAGVTALVRSRRRT